MALIQPLIWESDPLKIDGIFCGYRPDEEIPIKEPVRILRGSDIRVHPTTA